MLGTLLCLVLITSSARIKKIPLDALFQNQRIIKVNTPGPEDSTRDDLRNPIEEFLEMQLNPLPDVKLNPMVNKEESSTTPFQSITRRTNRVHQVLREFQTSAHNDQQQKEQSETQSSDTVAVKQSSNFLQSAYNIAQGTVNAIIGR
jgi:hypothetical protein